VLDEFNIFVHKIMIMATSVPLSPLNQDMVSPIDALWALYRSQNKRVRKAFRVRILAEEEKENEKVKMAAYEQNLTVAEREAAYQLADKIKKGVDDVQNAVCEHRPLGRSAEDFLLEIQQDCE
jgi:hypothetical protein